MQLIDWLIVGVFFCLVAGAGFIFSRKSAESSRSYFLGAENKWWMLAASGASTNFSINGTVWNLAILMVLGMKSFWVTLVWWMPNAVFLLAYSGLWIRRCGGITSAELNKIRFGVGTGAKWARTSFAFMITLFSVASLCMSYIIIHKFAVVFKLSNESAHALALGIVVLTSIYVVFGGFKGVIFSEFLQTVVLFAVAFIIGFVCYSQYSGVQIHAAVAHGSGDSSVTQDYWKSLWPEATPRIGMFEASGDYKDWHDFIGKTLAFSIVGMIGCIGGAGGRYGEQRFLAATNTKEAAKLAALWQFLGFPRWIMTAGLCFLGYALYTKDISHDPECVMPEFLRSGLLVPGLMGLVVAGLSASFMTSFCSEINACASIVVRDLYQPIFARRLADSDRKLVKVSYLMTACLAVLAIVIGYAMVESQRGDGRLTPVEFKAGIYAPVMAGGRVDLSQAVNDAFGRLDVNADGVLSPEECKVDPDAGADAEKAMERFRELDTDHDGSLTLGEFKTVPHPAIYFSKLDADSNGVLSLDEFKAGSRAGEDPVKAEEYFRKLDKKGSALNVIWGWMLGGLLTCFVVPLAFRWYWGRMNGWGFAAGCLASLVPSLAMLVRAFVPAGNFLKAWPDNYYTYITLATSTLACIIVSLLTPPIEGETSAAFYARVRPFGLWRDAEQRARAAGLALATAIPVPQILCNVALGLVASFSLYMAPVYFLGHWVAEGIICSATFAICCVALYFSWYRTLPED